MQNGEHEYVLHALSGAAEYLYGSIPRTQLVDRSKLIEQEFVPIKQNNTTFNAKLISKLEHKSNLNLHVLKPLFSSLNNNTVYNNKMHTVVLSAHSLYIIKLIISFKNCFIIMKS